MSNDKNSNIWKNNILDQPNLKAFVKYKSRNQEIFFPYEKEKVS